MLYIFIYCIQKLHRILLPFEARKYKTKIEKKRENKKRNEKRKKTYVLRTYLSKSENLTGRFPDLNWFELVPSQFKLKHNSYGPSWFQVGFDSDKD